MKNLTVKHKPSHHVVQYSHGFRTIVRKDENMEITMSEFKQNLNKYMQAVENGETVLLTRYGKPIATLQGVNTGVKTFAELRGVIKGDPNKTRKEMIAEAINEKRYEHND